jgi:hypothetical protein
VTENVADFRGLAEETFLAGGSHTGIIFASKRRFGRGIGPIVSALDQLLFTNPALDNLEYWLS